ncbi:MAG: hypothetical protein V4596_12060 [Bdellovibrionota bacterium]
MFNSISLILIVYTLFSGAHLWANACSELFDEVKIRPISRWPEDGPNASYEFHFQDVLKKHGVSEYKGYFERFLSDRKSQGLTTNALDLMGSGYYLKDFTTIDSMTGLRYENLSISKEEIERYGQPTEVTGNIFSTTTWQKLAQSNAERNIKGVDLIAMRPSGGWTNYPFKSTDHQAESIVFVLTNSVSILNPKGEIYFKLGTHNFNGDLIAHPAIVAFKEKLERETDFRLTLVTIYWKNENRTVQGQGVIKSK